MSARSWHSPRKAVQTGLAAPSPPRGRRPAATPSYPIPEAAPGHTLSRIRIHPGPTAAAPIQAARTKQVQVNTSKARIARRWQAAFGSRKNLATVKLRHLKSGRALYINSESLGMGNKSFTSPHETVLTKGGTAKKRKHSEPQLLLALENQKIKKGQKVIDLKNYQREWAFSTNEACDSDGEDCGSEVVPNLAPGNMPFYFQNPYSGSAQAGGFGKAYNQHYMKNEDSESESEAEDDIEDVLMITPSGMRGKSFTAQEAVPVEDMQSLLETGKHWTKRRSKRYQGRGFGN